MRLCPLKSRLPPAGTLSVSCGLMDGTARSETAACVYYGDECGPGPSGLCKCQLVTCALQKADVKAGRAAARAPRPPRAALTPAQALVTMLLPWPLVRELKGTESDTGHQHGCTAMRAVCVGECRQPADTVPLVPVHPRVAWPAGPLHSALSGRLQAPPQPH